MKKLRKVVYLLILIFSAISTPPDIINLTLCYLVMIISFEIVFFFTILKNNNLIR
jgi:Sec-independent protein secretion pathway component TatC